MQDVQLLDVMTKPRLSVVPVVASGLSARPRWGLWKAWPRIKHKYLLVFAFCVFSFIFRNELCVVAAAW